MKLIVISSDLGHARGPVSASSPAGGKVVVFAVVVTWWHWWYRDINSVHDGESTMANDVVLNAHATTLRTNIHDIVRQLNGHLGATLVATLAGVNDRKLPYRWARPDGPMPGDEAQQRLQTAHRIWLALTKSDSDHVARAWFIGANPLLDEVAPVMALRSGDVRETLKACQAFQEGAWQG
jgi:hypothetical protein